MTYPRHSCAVRTDSIWLGSTDAKHTPQSLSGGKRMTKRRPRLKAKTTTVLYALEHDACGLSSGELAKSVGIGVHSVAARANWLKRAGLVAFSNVDRVWTLTDNARRDLFRNPHGVDPEGRRDA